MYVNQDAKDWHSDIDVDPEVLLFHRRLPGYEPTPLRRLPHELCFQFGVREICVKDESNRCGLPAFKILGASWGAYRAVTQYLKCSTGISMDAVQQRAQAASIHLFTATDGNHGRAVARIAKILGIRATVYVPTIMHEKTRESIRQEEAIVEIVDSDYDGAVKAAEQHSVGAKGILVQDTAWPGYEEIPKWIVQGYSTMMLEIDQQMSLFSTKCPNLVVVPIGVGSLAHAVVAHYKRKDNNTMILAVEPETAGCLKRSLEQGQITTIDTEETSMCGMNCGTVSYTAWPYLRGGIDASITVTDEEAKNAQSLLHTYDINVGPCGTAALAALTKTHEHHRDKLHLSKDSTILLLATEGPR